MSSLRERQQDLTRKTIFDALAKIIREEGVDGFSVQRVADAAGVSHRTVYRHFPSREALLDALGDFLGSEFRPYYGNEGQALPELQPEQLGRTAQIGWQIFEQHAELVAPYVMLIVGARINLKGRQDRTTWFRGILGNVSAHLDDDEATAVAVLMRSLASTVMWHIAREHSDASPSALATTVRWAFETLVSDLRCGGGPHRYHDEDAS